MKGFRRRVAALLLASAGGAAAHALGGGGGGGLVEAAPDGPLARLARCIDKSDGGLQRAFEDGAFLLQTSRELAPRLLLVGLLLYPQASALWRQVASTARPWMKKYIPIDLYDQIVIPIDQEALLRLWLHVLHTIWGVHFLLSEATVRAFEVLVAYRMQHLPDLVYSSASGPGSAMQRGFRRAAAAEAAAEGPAAAPMRRRRAADAAPSQDGGDAAVADSEDGEDGEDAEDDD